MKNQRTYKITLTAVFLALGLLIPILFHAIGLGSTFLPMFWPLATGAFFLSMPYAMLLGLLTPLLSSLLTGMPPFSPPIVYVMMGELVVLNAAISLLHAHTRWGIFWILLGSLILSRFVLVVLVQLFAPLLGLPPQLFSIAAVIQGLPGMVVMMIFLPVLVSRLKKEGVFLRR
ncbi:ECF transporter S component [candidate division KSB1 bacterium]|nr:ECF transporter S component [candidate division KSB1 bacterium]